MERVGMDLIARLSMLFTAYDGKDELSCEAGV